MLGIYPLGVTNTWSGTKVIINAEIPEIAEFKTRYVLHNFAYTIYFREHLLLCF